MAVRYGYDNTGALATVTKDGVTWTNTYDSDGMRTKRTNGTNTYSYIYNGGSLSQMTVDGTVMNFAYDASGTPMAVTYGGATYYYATNIQGDVVAILNASGTAVVTYTYDAWGNILTTTGTLASTLGTHNPLRYRGYVYDPETGLYYLQSRYYNPQMGRFICADSLVSTGQGILGNNMFAYCGNNPVLFCDPAGYFWNEFWESIEEWLKDKKEQTQKNGDGTLTVGFTISGAFGVGVSYSTGVTLDQKGNVGFSGTINGGGGFPSAGAGGFASITNAPNIFKQEGLGFAIGGSGGPGVIAVGGDYNMLVDQAEGKTYHGGTFSATVGLYPTVVEVHGEVGTTKVRGCNIYDVLINIVDFIHE